MPTDEESFRNWLQPGSVPRGVPIPGGSEQAFLAVLEEIGTPVIWLGWSGGGSLGLSLVTQRPDLFRAFIGIESVGGGCLTGGSPDPAVVDAFADNDIPFLNVNGGAQVARQPDTCQPLVDAINEAGGMATLVNLPDVGIFGNSHQMMSEKNSDEIAEVLVDWIEGNVD